eukprot:7233971-Alexandrium_andersonii.AAC.1
MELWPLTSGPEGLLGAAAPSIWNLGPFSAFADELLRAIVVFTPRQPPEAAVDHLSQARFCTSAKGANEMLEVSDD